MEDIQNEEAYSKPVIEMLTVANEYCIFLEKIENYPTQEIFPYLQRILPLMYLKGSLLPEIKVDDSSFNEKFLTEEQWEIKFNELRNKFADKDEFWFINYEGPDETDPVKGSMAEHLTDIYQDMKDFVMLFQKSARASKQNAVDDIRKLFHDHWGSKVINALKLIHQLTKIDFPDDEYTDFL